MTNLFKRVTTTWLPAVFGMLMCSSCLAAQTCSTESLKGAYGFSVKGTNVVANVQFAITGRFESDGEGHFAGAGSESVSGSVFHTAFQGTYEINADCTGSAILQFSNNVAAHLEFVLVDDAAEILIIDTDQGTIETGVAKKQFRHLRAG